MAESSQKVQSPRTGKTGKALQIDSRWDEAVKAALKVKRPPGGWPKAEKPKKTKG